MDTTALELNGVEIHATRPYQPHLTLLDSLDLRRVRTESLGSWLEKRSNLYIMSYGAPGTASTFRYQGLAAAHTSVQWNQVPLGSRSLGLTDLSLVPMSTVQSAVFAPNAAQSNDALSTIGGALHLQSGTSGTNALALSSAYTSIENQTLEGALDLAGRKWSQRVVWTRQANQNRFTYRDDYRFGRPWLTQQHSASVMESAQHFAQWQPQRWQRSSFYTGVWWLHRKNELPEIMGSYSQSLQQQRDSSWRFTAGWNRLTTRGSITAQLAHLRDFQRYTDKARATDNHYSIDSRVNILQWIPQVFWNHRLDARWQIQAAAQVFAVKVQNTNYANGSAQEVYPLATATIRRTFSNGGITGNLRYEYRDAYTTVPAGGVYAWQKHTFAHAHLHSVQYSLDVQHKYRVPDFNERYWVTGVQAQLRPEQGWGAQATLRSEWWQQKRLPTILTLEAFAHHVADWIQWMPTNGTVWRPVNYKLVVSRGAQARWQSTYTRGKQQISAELSTQYTLSEGRNDQSDRVFEMPYAPRWMHALRLDYARNSFDVGVFARYVDVRFTNEQNTRSARLEAYYLLSATAGKTWSFSSFNLRTQLNLDNLTNTQYQTVRSYAMPGRVIGLAIHFTWKIKTHA